jgi:hypothetical protein
MLLETKGFGKAVQESGGRFQCCTVRSRSCAGLPGQSRSSWRYLCVVGLEKPTEGRGNCAQVQAALKFSKLFRVPLLPLPRSPSTNSSCNPFNFPPHIWEFSTSVSQLCTSQSHSHFIEQSAHRQDGSRRRYRPGHDLLVRGCLPRGSVSSTPVVSRDRPIAGHGWRLGGLF